MRVGLTYDLRDAYLKEGYSEEETAEFDRLSTIEAIEDAVRRLGHETERIGHARQLIRALADGARWDLVFNIAEGLRGVARESQVPAILEVYGIPYTFSDPLVMALSLHKGLAKRLLAASGVPTAPFAEIAELSDLDGLQLSFPLFAKPIAEGTGKGIDETSVVRRTAELRAQCAKLLARYRQPVLLEPFLPGREFTVGIIGTGSRAEVIGTLEVVLLAGAEQNVYSYVNKERCEELVEYRLARAAEDEEVRKAEAAALAGWRALGCRDAGRVDLRSDDAGTPQLLEINPLAGIHPEHSDLPILCTKVGIRYIDLIGRIIDSACERAAGAVYGRAGAP